jgi:formylglycine-generating enzyme required for sulfatase activity
MQNMLYGIVIAAGMLRLVSPGSRDQAVAGMSSDQTEQITIKGCLLCDWVTLPHPRSSLGPPPLDPEHKFAIYAFDGTPEIRANVERIIAELYPEKGLDGDAAKILQDQFTRRLKYFVSPDSPALKDMYKTLHSYECHGNAYALTGVLSEKDGRKWITVRNYSSIDRLTYPDRMLAPDRPFAPAGGEALILEIDATLSLKCILLPPGKFFMGTPFYMVPRHLEEYPHTVTLTRPFYMSEIPITQEIYQSVMGENPSPHKDPRLPVQDISCADVHTFCRILSERTGRKVRLPTDAEWEYAARVGTSNPAFPEKAAEQNSWVPGRSYPLPVRSKRPNAWGLYDLASGWWELVADQWRYNGPDAEVDPLYVPLKDEASREHTHRSHGLLTGRYSFGTIENIPSSGKTYVGTKFRIVVEHDPTTTASPPGRFR